jgi:hypothetical protein
MWAVIPLFECDYCGYQWTAVAPNSAEWLECPICHKMTPVDYELPDID